MKKTFKILTMTFCFCMVAFTVKTTAQTIIDQGTCGSDLTWILTDDYTLTISGSGEMNEGTPWLPHRDKIKTLIINDGVTSIGQESFVAHSQLNSVNIGNAVTMISSFAFTGCRKLTSIKIPNSVITIGTCAFFDCRLLTVNIGNSVKEIKYEAFAYGEIIDTFSCKANIPPTLYQNVFSTTHRLLIVPCGTLSAYQESDWGNYFSNIIEDCNSVNEMPRNKKIDVYPNPNTGELQITNYELRVKNIEVFDINGKKQKTESRKQKAEGEIVIDISHLPAGIYFVKVLTEQGEIVEKIVKQ